MLNCECEEDKLFHSIHGISQKLVDSVTDLKFHDDKVLNLMSLVVCPG